MVDPNPARGMPAALQRYWLVGKGALKVRWNIPGDFLRCVRLLRKYFPQDPKGLCNILHTKATGGPPGHGSLEEHKHSITAASQLLAAQPTLGETWAGPIAPIGIPTGEPSRKRIFEHGALDHRVLPLPLSYRKFGANGHTGAVTVGRILGITFGPDHKGQDYAWAFGDWLDPAIVPEVTEARYMNSMGIVGPSVDPGGSVSAVVNPENGAEHVTQYTIGGATLVPIPAFAALRLLDLGADGEWPDDDEDMTMSDEEDCGCGEAMTASVNATGWHGLPLAAREAVFDNDDAVQRIAAWAAGDPAKLNQAFMWRNPSQPEGAIESYRLPLGDIINGRLTLVFHAIYAAAALISGAHGGLPDVSEEDRNQIRTVISNIYPEMAKAFQDPSIMAPWDRRQGMDGMSMDEFASDNKPYGNVAYADPGYQEDKKKRYPLDTEEHCRAAWSYINQAGNADKYSAEQLKLIKARIVKALKSYGAEVNTGNADYSMSESGFPVMPPAAWFSDPKLTKKTPLTVTPEGRVFGHLAAWGECHRDVGSRECVLAPRSKMDYAPYHLGQVFTAEGDLIKVGKIVQDTRHASIQLGYAAAAIHYDDTGDEVAVVKAGEDDYGIWLAGAVVPEATPAKVAKLRRSPLSGDWRGINGNLELTAALAVNVPAFPVYAMENEQRLALVAAGTVYPDNEEFQMPENLDEVDVDEADEVDTDEANEEELSPEQEDRAWELRELLDIEDQFKQDQRAQQLEEVFAAAQETVVPNASPPASGMTASGNIFGPEAMLARQLDAQYSVITEEGAGADHPAPPPPDAAPVAPVAPAVPAPPVAPATAG